LINSHTISEEVLHRDIRPSNIVIPHFFNYESFGLDANDKWNVVLLNYDVPWHKFASGTTISGRVEDLGYYSPEQINETNEVSSQSTLVDSYMFGMLAFFAAAGNDPPRAGGASDDWGRLITQSVPFPHTSSWKSVRNRVQRLVYATTAVDQFARMSLSTAYARLIGIRDVLREDFEKVEPDFWAEELFYRIVDRPVYQWSDDNLSGQIELRKGRTLSILLNPKNNVIQLSFNNVATEATARGGLSRMWQDRLDQASNSLASSGWDVLPASSARGGIIFLKAEISVDTLKDRFSTISRGAAAAIERVKLD
jgi:serine/threonine protein kinase